MIKAPGRVGVAISTTGDPHRLPYLRESVRHWDHALVQGDSLFVTVDGDEDATARVAELVHDITGSVYRVGQPLLGWRGIIRGGRIGVAANKNTGLELLMDNTRVEHLFLSDDDTWPLYRQSIERHIETPLLHSMVCWGRHRLVSAENGRAVWSWPRGVLLYAHRTVINEAGGMDERFGPGGHEHAEWSERIYNLGFTPSPFVSPASYATRNATGARALWHCEDMRRPYESLGDVERRRRALTSVRRMDGDWDQINKIKAERVGSTDLVQYRAQWNGRASATLSPSPLGRGIGGD